MTAVTEPVKWTGQETGEEIDAILNHGKSKNRNRFRGLMSAVSSMISTDSGSRIAMLCSMLSQSVTPRQSDVPRILTGFERQLADYTWGVSAPDDLQIVEVINQYDVGLGQEGIRTNPLITVIYRSMTDGSYGVFHLESYLNQSERVHETFSFQFQFTDITHRLHKGMILRKGDVLSYTPNIHKNGLYSNTVTANMAYMSMPATTEDGFIVSESLMHRSQPLATGSRVAEWGRKYYPINLYGDRENYKPFPDIGDTIRADGIVIALRKYDPVMEGLQMTHSALMEPDYLHDTLEYGQAGAKVYDVIVDTTTNELKRLKDTPVGMEVQANKYSEGLSTYHLRIIETVDGVQREEKGRMVLSPELQTLVVRAKGDKPNVFMRKQNLNNTGVMSRGRKNTVTKTIKASAIDEWRVEVKYQFRFPIGKGAKLSGRHGVNSK